MPRLTKGQQVRCRNEQNDVMGVVLSASDTQPQSVAVFLGEDAEGIRMSGGGLAITNMIPLIVDYEAETVADLFGNTWEIDYTE